MKFKVVIRQVFEKEIRLDADSEYDAKKLAEENFNSGMLKFSPEDQQEMEFTARYDGDADLVRDLRYISSTVSMMNEYETRQGNKHKYRRLILRNFDYVGVDHGKEVYANPIIERLRYGAKSTGDVTISKLKRDNDNYHVTDVDHYIRSYLKKLYGQNCPKPGTEVLFDIPYHLRAQTSDDRRPGNYDGFNTEYGQTHDYGIVGVEFSYYCSDALFGCEIPLKNCGE